MDISQLLARLCSNCGSGRHQSHRCQERENSGPCQYPHGGMKIDRPHSILTCPALHSYCSICFLRGHHPSQHQTKNFSQAELMARYFKYMPLGLYTCLPFQTRSRKGKTSLRGYHFRMGVAATTFWRDPITRFKLDLSTRHDPAKHKPHVSTKMARDKKTTLIEKKKARKFPGEIPRFLIRKVEQQLAHQRRMAQQHRVAKLHQRVAKLHQRGAKRHRSEILSILYPH